MADEQNALVPQPIEYIGFLPDLPALPALTAIKPYWVTSIADKTPEGKSLILRCLNGADVTGDQMVNTEFTIRDVLYHSIRLVDKETGEVSYPIRVVLVLSDGRTLQFVSTGVLKSLIGLIAMFGPPPWAEGLTVHLRQLQLDGARRFYQLQHVPTPTAQKKGSKS